MNTRIPQQNTGTNTTELNPNDTSELHGILCGLLCLEQGLRSESWLDYVASTTTVSQYLSQDALTALHSATVEQLVNEDFAFALLLPDDEHDLNVRAAALGSWCQGFLSGLGLAGLQQKNSLPDEIQEFISDVSEIAWVGFDLANPDEEDEAAYAEIVEYLRIGVLFFNQELSGSPAGNSRTIH